MELFRNGIFAGLGWAIGVTIGFAIISTILVLILKQIGPFLGEQFETVVESTEKALERRTPLLPR